MQTNKPFTSEPFGSLPSCRFFLGEVSERKLSFLQFFFAFLVEKVIQQQALFVDPYKYIQYF